MEDEFKTIKEIEKYLKVTRQAVCAWIKSGKLRAYKVGRYWRVKKSDLSDFIEGRNN